MKLFFQQLKVLGQKDYYWVLYDFYLTLYVFRKHAELVVEAF